MEEESPAPGQARGVLCYLTDNFPDQVYVKDTQSRFISVNPETARFLGVPAPEAVVGKTDFDFFPHDLARQFLEEEQDLMLRNQPCINREAAITDTEGHTRRVLTTKVPLRDANGRVTGLLGVNRDITEMRQTQEALRRLNVELERRVTERTLGLEAANVALQAEIERRKHTEEELLKAVNRLEAQDQARSAFVFNVSHELKTPLTSMAYGIDNVLRGVTGPLPERLQEYMRMLKEDCQRISKTVADILDLGRLESNTMRLNMAPLPFDRLVRRAVAALSTQAHAKNIAVKLTSTLSGAFVGCDAFKMERVMINIIDNAIKFTPAGGIVDIALHRDPTPLGHVVVEVADNGIGIAPQHLNRVTERFYRVGEHISGTGLGLTIAKEIIALHGGNLEIRSPPPQRDKGTSVAIRLPASEPPTVLLADDEEDVRCILERQLRASGYDVVSCGNGRDALDLVRQKKPHVCILDVFMPVMDGTEVILHLKADETLRGIPTLVVSGGALDREKQELLEGFGIAALPKPWPEDELLSRIETALMGAALTWDVARGQAGG